MAAAKFLVVVVDGTAAMGPHWTTIVSDYLQKIVRHCCGRSNGQDANSGATVHLGLVQYNSHGPTNTGCLVRASAWTSDVDRFLDWLSGMTFVGGGHNESAIADGLAEALIMFPKPPIGSGTDHQQFNGEKHCILVAASNPFLLAKHLYLPIIRNGQFPVGIKTEWCYVDTETVAKSFAECSISLSLISPKKLPKLRDIYNAGNNDFDGTPSFSDVKNPHFLVLLSKKFPEALAALSQFEMNAMSSPVSETNTTISLPPSVFELDLSEEDISWLRELLDIQEPEQQADHAENVPAETETMAARPQNQHVSQPAAVTNVASSSRTAPPAFSGQNIMARLLSASTSLLGTGESSTMPIRRQIPRELQLTPILDQEYQELMASLHGSKLARRSMVPPATPPKVSGSSKNFLRPVFPTIEISRPVFASSASNMPADSDTPHPGMKRPHHTMAGADRSDRFLGNPGKGKTTVAGPFNSVTTSGAPGNQSVLRPFSSIQGHIGLGPPPPRASQRNYSGAHVEQQGRGGCRPHFIGAFGQFGEQFVAVPSAPVATMPPRMYGGLMPAAIRPIPKQEYERDLYLLAWEGTISAKYQQQALLVSRAKAYKKASAPERLTAGWPPSLEMGNVLPQIAFNRLPYQGHADVVIFETTNSHKIYDILKRRELCVRISLPSQSMIFTPADHNRFIGTIFSDLPLFKGETSALDLEQQDEATRQEQHQYATCRN